METQPSDDADAVLAKWEAAFAARFAANLAAAKQGAVETRDLVGQMKRAQVAARDAAVANVIADVPAGCDGERWANVVRVIAAGLHEDHAYRKRSEPGKDARDIHYLVYGCGLREGVSAYARLRFVHGYDKKEAAEQAADVTDWPTEAVARYFAAYEAGR